jgi:Tol biopolymer transport system component
MLTSLIIVLLTGCSASQLTPSPEQTISVPTGTSPSSSILSGKILYIVPGDTVHVFVADPDGNGAFLVLSGAGIRTAALSPDGKLVAYIIDDILYVKDLTDGSTRQLLSEPISGFFKRMEWSPDSEWIGFDCLVNGISEICAVNVPNGLLNILTNAKSFGAQFLDGATFGSWNEDGSKIVYCLKVSNSQGGVPSTRFMILNIKDSSSIGFMDEKNNLGIVNYGCPVYQSNTQFILFTAKQHTKYMIFSASITGENITRITDSLLSYDIHDPIVVSPTGEYFLANSAKQDSNELIDVPTLFSADGQIVIQLELPGAQVLSWVHE